MAPNGHVFDVLNRWARLPSNEIEEIVSDEAIKTLKQVVDLLVDGTEQKKPVVRSTNFVDVVAKMREAYKVGSRTLGEAILEASEYIERGEVDKAKVVYRRFLSSCTAPFYRRIAEKHLRDLT